MGYREVSIEGVNKFKLINDKMQTWRIWPFYKFTTNSENFFCNHSTRKTVESQCGKKTLEEINTQVFPSMMENMKQVLKVKVTWVGWIENTPSTTTSQIPESQQ